MLHLKGRFLAFFPPDTLLLTGGVEAVFAFFK
jgi:hypothetical protein